MLSILFGPIIIKFVLWLVSPWDITTRVRENPENSTPPTLRVDFIPSPRTQLKMSYPHPYTGFPTSPPTPTPDFIPLAPIFNFRHFHYKPHFLFCFQTMFLFFALLTGAFTVFEVVARFFGQKITICQKIRFQCKGKLYPKFRFFLNFNGALPSKRANNNCITNYALIQGQN